MSTFLSLLRNIHISIVPDSAVCNMNTFSTKCNFKRIILQNNLMALFHLQGFSLLNVPLRVHKALEDLTLCILLYFLAQTFLISPRSHCGNTEEF